VPEDPPDFRREPSGLRPVSARTKSAALRSDAGRRELGRTVRGADTDSGPLLNQPLRDSFDRAELGPDWKATSPAWSVEDGALCGKGARNRPVWLNRRLPVNARIEFDARSDSPQGDLKAEIWGDGRSFATTTSYSNATSYIVVFGGWKNSLHVLARLDEHHRDRLELKIDPDSDDPRQHPVSEGQTYHFKIERTDGKTVRWFVDDLDLHALVDPAPLKGPGHEYFAFNNWEVHVCFDNVRVTPLEG
jgi:hypothetical protein